MKTFDEIKQALAGCKPGRCVPDRPYGDRIGCVQELHRDTLAMVQQLEAQAPKWISVEERLPEDCGEVLFVLYGRVYLGDYLWNEAFETPAGSVFFAGEAVTHWMPLPEPPKEE